MTTPHDYNQNCHGVNLSEIKEDDYWPVRMDYGRTVAKVLYANMPEDKFVIEISDPYETTEHTVTGDTFRQPITEIRNSISDEEFAALEPHDKVGVYLEGYERMSACWVEEIDYDDNQVLLKGECNCQTIHRWVDQGLIRSPTKPD